VVGGGPSSGYTYDGQGRRVRDFVGASKYSVYGTTGALVYDSDGRTGVTHDYIQFGGSLVAIRSLTSGVESVQYQHTDALGSVVARSSAGRSSVIKTGYEPYGALTNRPYYDQPAYAGHVGDTATGLDYMQQRYYDPQVGRFLSVDPVTANSGTGANFNRYWYADNNPYKFTDIDGRDAIYFTDTRTLVYLVYFKGAGAADKDLIAAIKSRVDGLKSSDSRIQKVMLIVLDRPGGAGTSTMDLSPGKDYANFGTKTGEGTRNRKDAHIDSSREDVVGAATHDINHFGGAPEGYIDFNSRNERGAINASGYTDKDIMGRNTDGNNLTPNDVDFILKSDTTYQFRQDDSGSRNE
jgi:RHS repeat-associated protein